MKLKKFISIIISLIMLLSVCSIGAFAEESSVHTDEDAVKVEVMGTAGISISESYPPQFGGYEIGNMRLYVTYSDGEQEVVEYAPAHLNEAKITFYYYISETKELIEVEENKIKLTTTDPSEGRKLIYTVKYAEADYQALKEKYPNAQVNNIEPTDERVLSLGLNIADRELFLERVYRLYNPNSGEHFYTIDINEKGYLVSIGWKYENIGWYAPNIGDDVYRLYNSNAGDHHYTTDINEVNYLCSLGWKLEGVAFCSDGFDPIYRRYNPNAVSGTHFFTADRNEGNNLVSIGWHDEAVAFYGFYFDGIIL